MTDTKKPEANRRGWLTIYIGAAPGVGKTYKMLQDANDWRRKGLDVVAGLIETHGRKDTQVQIGDLEVLPLKSIMYQGRVYHELDVEGIIERAPKVVLIDELAHTNVPGSVRKKRYQDIEEVLNHGIDVVTTVNIQHLESLQDKIEHITGVKVRERVPDSFIDNARQVKLIDVSPETLQKRLEEGKIYSLDKVENALNHFFQLGNLAALREIALLEVADDVEQRMDKELSRRSNRISVERERILVCVNYRPHSEKLIRRGWRIADRLNAKLYVLVVVSDDMTAEEERDLTRIEALSRQFEAIFIKKRVGSRRVGEIIVEVAEEVHVSQLVIGQPLPRKNGLWSKFQENPVDYVLEHAEFMDLHVVANSREVARQP